MIRRCGGQVRAGFGGAYALDFTAVLTTARAMGAETPLLVELLPLVEPLVVGSYRKEGDDGSD